MTEHKPGDVVGIFVNKVQIQVTDDHADKPNSYRTISRSAGADTATVTVEAGKTFFQYDGELFLFDGVTYRPNSDYRDDDLLSDGEVKMVAHGGFHPSAGHTFNPLRGAFTLSDLKNALVSGELEPREYPPG